MDAISRTHSLIGTTLSGHASSYDFPRIKRSRVLPTYCDVSCPTLFDIVVQREHVLRGGGTNTRVRGKQGERNELPEKPGVKVIQSSVPRKETEEITKEKGQPNIQRRKEPRFIVIE